MTASGNQNPKGMLTLASVAGAILLGIIGFMVRDPPRRHSPPRLFGPRHRQLRIIPPLERRALTF